MIVLNRNYKMTKVTAAHEVSSCAGQCETHNAQITIIDYPCDEDFLKDTLLHETLHAIDYEYGIGLENKEEVINRLTKALIRTFRDNPALIPALTAGKLEWNKL